jgi:hypothetical protein
MYCQHVSCNKNLSLESRFWRIQRRNFVCNLRHTNLLKCFVKKGNINLNFIILGEVKHEMANFRVVYATVFVRINKILNF